MLVLCSGLLIEQYLCFLSSFYFLYLFPLLKSEFKNNTYFSLNCSLCSNFVILLISCKMIVFLKFCIFSKMNILLLKIISINYLHLISVIQIILICCFNVFALADSSLYILMISLEGCSDLKSAQIFFFKYVFVLANCQSF